ncbi:sensor histidine kinase [Shewanella fidelis]|uniref:histidine kinase n=1 Tax=Shewanella fidelis TaxID=173509 RepID=A0AAW8NKN2_9GAMM|nr:HAMP domain-containing sensor histidine kinase [Shewanella fidelis]MDR8522289.1 HAMP domain-containing sensor histidine kinase [Shewanella fidelis]MDW4812495.1 HAMP domain-containing sensor histidine kinase [Shewanella fidelis]MDW4816242.1 HAMP domain-containing sensor histidine kinase [Shewanella fidelis]MDW4820736.1 HAMP domain-containing sensor histidine kinase [Shewanella fidelis]MDW4824958.1 HAMP domain-containing sensor histidine kinase [Shewanella fidelis]
MLSKLFNRASLAVSLPQKLLIYFSAIALMIGLTIYVFMLSIMQWIEDEVNQHELEASAPFAISLFQQGARQPLQIGLHVQAFYSHDFIPEAYGDLSQFPAGFSGEVVDRNQTGLFYEIFSFKLFNKDELNAEKELFLYRSEFLLDGKIQPLYLVMPADNVELSDAEWQSINLFVLIFIGVLFLLFGFAIHKLSQRLVEPVDQLVKQLKSPAEHPNFSVPKQSAAEFSQLSQSLNDYRQQNEMMIKQEQAFARYASHELRTPITVISGAAKLQEQNDAPAFQARQRDRIQRAAHEMQHTVDALLSIVKQEKGTVSHQARRLERAEIEQIIQPLILLAQAKKIALTIDFKQAPLIKPTPAVLRMLLSNIVTNAINASDSGQIQVIVDTDHISINDNGRGLTSSQLEQQSEQYNGHGLGLLIVDSLCQRYHWQFSLKEIEPRGCQAKLTFPQLDNT